MELLRDRSAEFEEAGVRAVGISRDSPWSHVAWMQALDLSFPLLSDWNAEAVRGFGIAHEHRGLQVVAARRLARDVLGARGETRVEMLRRRPHRSEPRREVESAGEGYKAWAAESSSSKSGTSAVS